MGNNPGEGKDNPLQDSCLESSIDMDRGAWRATVHGVEKTEHDYTHTHIWNDSSGILYLNREVQEVQEVQAWATAADLTLKEKSVWKDPGSLPYGGTVMAMSRQHTVLGQMPRDGIFRLLKSNHWVCTEYIWIYKDSIHEVMCWK